MSASSGAPAAALTLLLAWRFFRSARRGVVALVSGMSLAGIAIGVAALTLSVAALDGFQGHIRERLLADTPHLRVAPRAARTELGPALAQLRALPGADEPRALVEARGWLLAERSGEGHAALVRGGEVAAPRDAPADGPSPIVLEDVLAAGLGLGRGDTVSLLSPRTRLSPVGPLPVVKRFRVAATVPASASGEGNRAVVPRQAAAELFGLPAAGNVAEVQLADPEKAGAHARSLRAALGSGWRVDTWEDLNAPLVLTLRLEKLVVFAAISLVILVATLNLVANLAMTVVEKQGEIGALLAMGGTPALVRRAFATLGLLIGSLGTALGLALGAGGAELLDRARLLPLPADVYALDHVPFRLQGADAAVIAVVSLLFAVAASWYPARRAARLEPVEALRAE